MAADCFETFFDCRTIAEPVTKSALGSFCLTILDARSVNVIIWPTVPDQNDEKFTSFQTCHSSIRSLYRLVTSRTQSSQAVRLDGIEFAPGALR